MAGREYLARRCPKNVKRRNTGRKQYRYRDSNPGFRHERAAS